MGNGLVAEVMYRLGLAPWDIGASQPIIRQLVALGAVVGNVLDPGCGTGHHAIEYARAGCSVTAVDVAPTAIERARFNARDAGVHVTFKTRDITELDGPDGYFDTVVDCKLYDNLDDADARAAYVSVLQRVMRPGSRLIMFGFGAGSVNGVHNHLLEDSDVESDLGSANFAVTHVGSSTYQLANREYRPICAKCPTDLPGGVIHIPVTEVHATRTL